MVDAPPASASSTGELAGSRVLVTGGTRGLGSAIARHLAAAGADVVVAARSRGQEQVTGRFVAADVSTAQGAHALAAATLDLLGGIDVLVDNAGGQTRAPGGALALSDEDWQQDLSTNLLSAVRLDRELVPVMVAQGSGVVIHITSGAAHLPQPAALAYAAAKAALTTYSKGLAGQVGPFGVRVNTVVPGVIETSALATRLALLAEESGTDLTTARHQLAQRFGIPLARTGQPDDVAALVTFLASPRATYLTGSQYFVDGGLIPTV